LGGTGIPLKSSWSEFGSQKIEKRRSEMETRTYTVYKFNELPEAARDKVLDRYAYLNVEHDWWEFTFEDAARVGIKIEEFDIDRGSYCRGKFLWEAPPVADAIIEEHGENCETRKTAEAFIKERDEAVDTAPRDENGDFVDEYALDRKLNEIEEEFKKSIFEDYRIILQKEYEHLTSEEAIIETIEANDYDFTIDGRID
jgi:hypothetical protein